MNPAAKKKQHILIVSSNYWPEPTGIGLYTSDLSAFLYHAGFDISVLTGLPHYPWWKIPETHSHLSEGIYDHNGLRTIRVNHYIPTKFNALTRIFFELSLWINLRRVANQFVDNDFHLVIAVIPTVAAGDIGRRFAKKLRIPLGLIVQDLSGLGAKQSGIPGGSIISSLTCQFENFLLSSAKQLVLVSPSMINYVRKSGVENSKVTTILNYSVQKIEISHRKTNAKGFGWSKNDFIVLHTGNIGAKQQLEIIIEAAKLLTDELNIKFFLVGHGSQEMKIKESCKYLTNISVLPSVPESDYSQLLASADLLIINERETQTEMSLPSKLTSYLFSNRPILAAVPREGATWKYLEGIAQLVEAGNSEKIAKTILLLKEDKKRRDFLAKAGLEFAENHLEVNLGRKKYLNWINSLLNQVES